MCHTASTVQGTAPGATVVMPTARSPAVTRFPVLQPRLTRKSWDRKMPKRALLTAGTGKEVHAWPLHRSLGAGCLCTASTVLLCNTHTIGPASSAETATARNETVTWVGTHLVCAGAILVSPSC
jgi:hypothetical protein